MPVTDRVKQIASWWSKSLASRGRLTQELEMLVQAVREDPTPSPAFVAFVAMVMPTSPVLDDLEPHRADCERLFPQHQWSIVECETGWTIVVKAPVVG